jgi:hypothetical protein
MVVGLTLARLTDPQTYRQPGPPAQIEQLNRLLVAPLVPRVARLSRGRLSNQGLTVVGRGLVTIGVGVTFVARSRPWHGAEHMTIAAYERSGSTRPCDVQCESPINDHCGGRLVLPLLLVGTVWAAAPIRSRVLRLILGAVLVEAGLQVERLWGWDRIPVFAQASRLLQRCTTRQPDEQHLAVARIAMAALLKAHATVA